MKCKHHYKIGKYIRQTFVGSHEFLGSEVITMSYGGKGKLSKCFKCSKCGHSITC